MELLTFEVQEEKLESYAIMSAMLPTYFWFQWKALEEIGQKTELTTVTKLPRRIFTFSRKQIGEAIEYNGAREIFLNFVNYCKTEEEVQDIVESIERSPNTFVRWIGLGPEYKDVYSMPQYGKETRMARILELWRAYATGRINSTHG